MVKITLLSFVERASFWTGWFPAGFFRWKLEYLGHLGIDVDITAIEYRMDIIYPPSPMRKFIHVNILKSSISINSYDDYSYFYFNL